jgi:glutamyl-tRNA synthetase
MVTEGQELPEEAVSAIEKNALLNAVRHGGRAEVGVVMSRVLGDFPGLRSDPGDVAREVSSAVKRVNSMSVSEQKSMLESRYPGTAASGPRVPEVHQLRPLEGAVRGKSCFRLPPEPSGFMTIGHAMAFTVNSVYKEMYDGKLWLRFEDTNPKKVDLRYYESFRHGINWLSIKCDNEKNVSDDMEVLYEYGRRMLAEGTAYACSCGAAKVKSMRFEGTECEHRNVPESVSLRVWDELLAKKHHEGEYVVRFRGDMKNTNFSLRDPNLFRVIEHTHPMTLDRYTLWPTYYLANTIEDHICGITHILRSSEFNPELQQRIRRALGLSQVQVVQFSRYNFKGTPVHKRLLRALVEQKLVSGWDDPRMPTVEGVRRRGIIPDAIRQFTVQVGYTKTQHEYDWSLLFSLNRKILDPVAKRLFFVPDPVELTVDSAPLRRVTIPFHPGNNLGTRTVETKERFFVPSSDLREMESGTIFRLMDLFNLKLTSREKVPSAKYAGDELIPETRKLQWVTPNHREATVMVFDALYDEKGEFIRSGRREVSGYVEESAEDLGLGEIVQFLRFGFCRKDSPSTFILAHK